MHCARRRRAGAFIALDDLLRLGSALAIRGTAAGKESAASKSYYTGKGNRLWKILAAVGLTPGELRSDKYMCLLACSIGLTDTVSGQAGMDDSITHRNAEAGRVRSRTLSTTPRSVCFNSTLLHPRGLDAASAGATCRVSAASQCARVALSLMNSRARLSRDGTRLGGTADNGSDWSMEQLTLPIEARDAMAIILLNE